MLTSLQGRGKLQQIFSQTVYVSVNWITLLINSIPFGKLILSLIIEHDLSTLSLSELCKFFNLFISKLSIACFLDPYTRISLREASFNYFSIIILFL